MEVPLSRVERRARRRSDLEMVGLVAGILAITFLLALTLGTAPLV